MNFLPQFASASDNWLVSGILTNTTDPVDILQKPLPSLPPVSIPFLWKEGTSLSQQSRIDNKIRFEQNPPHSDGLTLEWLISPKGRALSDVRKEREEEVWPDAERIIARMMQQEAREPENDFKTDRRIATLTVIHAVRGDAVKCTPQVLASYEVIGCHPDQVWPRILARRAAMLGVRPIPITKGKRLPSPTISKKERKIA
jgi:lambda repressor-like predicted transcriptional regulator